MSRMLRLARKMSDASPFSLRSMLMAYAIRLRARDGSARVFEVLQAEPLSFESLCSYIGKRQTVFKIRARVREHDAAGVRVGGEKAIEFDMSFPDGIPHYGLVPSGVLPPDFLLRGGTRMMLDRNVLSDLRRLQAAGHGMRHPLAWMDTDGFYVNPILGAMEGSKRRPLCRSEFDNEVRDATEVVMRTLPRANTVKFDGVALAQMCQQHLAFVPRLRREQGFLYAVSQRLVDSVSTSELRTAEKFVLQTAADLRVRPLTLVVLTVLAKLYEGTDQRPAGRLLKLADIRSAGRGWRQASYNAVADIRQMEVLSTGVTMPDSVCALTGDIALAQMWCGLRPIGVKSHDGTIQLGYNLDPALFPRLKGSTDDMLDRMRVSCRRDV